MAKGKRSSSVETESAKSQQQSSLVAGLGQYITNAISDADEAAAAERVSILRAARPETGTEALVQSLTRQKCLQTGAIGAITSGASLVPGLGTMVALTFGVAADIGMTFKMQAELVLEIAAAYEHELSATEKQKVVMLVTGISASSSMMLEKAGQQIAQKATERLAQKSVTKGIPVIGVAASAATNMLFTYIIGQRADAYFGRGPEAMGDWAEDLRALSGLDERVLIEWLIETTERSWSLVSGSAQNVAGAVIVAGQSTGEVIVVNANRVSEIVRGAGQGAIQGVSSATGKVVETSKLAGASVATTANAATGSAFATGKWTIAGLATGAGSAAGVVADAGRKAGQGVASGAGKASEFATGAGRSAVKGVGAAAGAVAGTGKKARQGVTAGAGKAKNAVAGIFKRDNRKNEEEQDDDQEDRTEN